MKSKDDGESLDFSNFNLFEEIKHFSNEGDDDNEMFDDNDEPALNISDQFPFSDCQETDDNVDVSQANAINLQTNPHRFDCIAYPDNIDCSFPQSLNLSASSQNYCNSESYHFHQTNEHVEQYQNASNQNFVQSLSMNLYYYPPFMRIDQNFQMNSIINLNCSVFNMSQKVSHQYLRQQVSSNVVGMKRKTIKRNLTDSGKKLRDKLNKIIKSFSIPKNVSKKGILKLILNIAFESLKLNKVKRDEYRCITDLYNNRAEFADQIIAYIQKNKKAIKKQINFYLISKKLSQK